MSPRLGPGQHLGLTPGQHRTMVICRVLIITGLRVVGQGPRYGNPRRWEPSGSATPTQPQQLTPPAQRECISRQEAQLAESPPNALLRKRKAESPCRIGREASLTGASSRQWQDGSQYNVEARQATPVRRQIAGVSRSAHTLGPLTPEAVDERRLHNQPLVPISCESLADHNPFLCTIYLVDMAEDCKRGVPCQLQPD